MDIREFKRGEFIEFAGILSQFLGGAQGLAKPEMQRVFDWALDPESNFVVLGAVQGDEVMGVVSIAFARSTYQAAPFGWLDDLFVKEAHRGQGIAKRLLAKAHEVAKERGCSNILLGVGEEERSVIKLYRSEGYSDLGCRLMTLPLKGVASAPGRNAQFVIQPVETSDRDWIGKLLAEHWGSRLVVVHGTTYQPQDLPGFLAIRQGNRVGLITYNIDGNACEIVTLNSLVEGQGVGTALIKAAKEVSQRQGCQRLWLTTTNDNLSAIGFYQRRGFAFAAVHPGAVTESRKVKPEIPAVGANGIPIRDEIELEIRH